MYSAVQLNMLLIPSDPNCHPPTHCQVHSSPWAAVRCASSPGYLVTHTLFPCLATHSLLGTLVPLGSRPLRIIPSRCGPSPTALLPSQAQAELVHPAAAAVLQVHASNAAFRQVRGDRRLHNELSLLVTGNSSADKMATKWSQCVSGLIVCRRRLVCPFPQYRYPSLRYGAPTASRHPQPLLSLSHRLPHLPAPLLPSHQALDLALYTPKDLCRHLRDVLPASWYRPDLLQATPATAGNTRGNTSNSPQPSNPRAASAGAGAGAGGSAGTAAAASGSVPGTPLGPIDVEWVLEDSSAPSHAWLKRLWQLVLGLQDAGVGGAGYGNRWGMQIRYPPPFPPASHATHALALVCS